MFTAFLIFIGLVAWVALALWWTHLNVDRRLDPNPKPAWWEHVIVFPVVLGITVASLLRLR